MKYRMMSPLSTVALSRRHAGRKCRYCSCSSSSASAWDDRRNV